MAAPETPVRVVHLVAKTHLDLGFTALASEVAATYLESFFPRAVEVANELRARGGPERLVWTTGSWILQQALADPDDERAARVAEAVRAGDLAWHALPLTFHTELMDADLVRSALAISAGLDLRFGRSTTAAKMTDVPGHTRGLVPLLAEAGVSFLHLGVNPAWPLPDVPPVFRWRAPDGAEVTVAYQSGGYGGQVVIPGCEHALAFLHSGDNLGPPSVDEVIEAHDALRDRFPTAVVIASTLDGFARALAGSEAVADLPVVTAEIGDPWLFGAGSDPQKVRGLRAALRHPARSSATDSELLLAAEHTWGLDQKVALPQNQQWDRTGLNAVRESSGGRRFEASWDEQRGYVDRALASLDADQSPIVPRPSWAAGATGTTVPGMRRVQAGEVVAAGAWSVGVDARGAVVHLESSALERAIGARDHPLGLVSYQSFDEADYARFYAQLVPTPEDEPWARWDNTKPGIDAAGARHGTWFPELTGAWASNVAEGGGSELVLELCFAGLPTETFGAPPQVWIRWRLDHAGRRAEVDLWWDDKPANRLPEATWCSFVPMVTEPNRWVLDKLGQAVSPLDVVARGGRSLHAVGEGMHYRGPEGALTIETLDAPLVAPGAPNLLDADPPLPDLAGGFHVLLHDNCWGTNFPMWNEGPAGFRFVLVADGPPDPRS